MTTLYVIDSTTDQLFIQVNPNAGTLQRGRHPRPRHHRPVGFDISANDNLAYAIADVDRSGYQPPLSNQPDDRRASLVGAYRRRPIRGITVLSRGVR